MTGVIDTRSKRALSARRAIGLAVSAFLLLGAFAGAASAKDHRDGDRRGEHRGDDHRGARGYYGYSGGYYSAPPVVYGSPYGYPPPVVYGPSIGINLPGISVGIR